MFFSPHFLLSCLASVFLWTKQGRNKLPTTAWQLQIPIKQTAEQKTESREGAPLLSRGLRLPIILSTCWQVGCHSVCLATQLPSRSPLQHPFTFHPALFQFTTCWGEEDPRTFRRMQETKEEGGWRGRLRRVWLQEVRLWFWKHLRVTRQVMEGDSGELKSWSYQLLKERLEPPWNYFYMWLWYVITCVIV